MAQITLNSSGVASSGSLLLQTNGTTTQATLDTSGNLGLGVTPSASWASGWKVFSIGLASLAQSSAGNDNLEVVNNAYYNGTNFIYQANDYATRLSYNNNGQFRWYNAASGTAGNAITFTQAMTLDASGRLGIGVTSPSCASDVQSSGNLLSRFTSTDVNGVYSTWRYNSNTVVGYIGSAKQLIGSGSPSAADFCIDASGANNLIFGVNDTERARIDSSGNLLVGTTSSWTTARLNISGATSNASATIKVGTDGNYGLSFYNSASSLSGGIVVNTSTVAYQTSSDYRLKENIAPMTGALSKVAALKPCTYTWKSTGEEGQGFIAHELQEVVPDAVTGAKDAVDEDGNPVYQGIDTSFLVATLTAAIQEQQAIITQLQADVAALKG